VQQQQYHVKEKNEIGVRLGLLVLLGYARLERVMLSHISLGWRRRVGQRSRLCSRFMELPEKLCWFPDDFIDMGFSQGYIIYWYMPIYWLEQTG